MENIFSSRLSIFDSKYPHLKEVHFDGEYVGDIDTRGEGSFVTRRKTLFKKFNGFGIHALLLNCSEIKFNLIIVYYDNKRLITTREYFLTHSNQYDFPEARKLFLPITEFKIDETDQISLFKD